jgi:hypothetical protein
MIPFFQLTTSALLWLVVITVHADKVRVSRLNREESGPLQVNWFTDGTHGKSGRFLKKTKKSKAPASMKKSKALRVTSCITCYRASDWSAFVSKLTDVTNYNVNTPLVLNICTGEIITIPDGPVQGKYYISLPSIAGVACTCYPVTIKCCGDNYSCGLDSTGIGKNSAVYYNQDDVSVVIDLKLDGITISLTAPDKQAFFALEQSTVSCLNSVSGSYKSTTTFAVATEPVSANGAQGINSLSSDSLWGK